MGEWNKKDHYGLRTELLLALGCFLAAIFLWFCQVRAEQYHLAERIAPQILRLHVVANSNSETDQELKLKVKSFFLEQLYGEMELDRAHPADGRSWSKSDVLAFLSANRRRLELETEAFLRTLGADDPVSLEITWCQFPEKYYGDITLPAGNYEAAQVRIGKGLGHNWWCVLYPKVCITKDAVAVVPEASREELKALLPEEDYLALQSKRPVIHMDFQLRKLFSRLLAGKQPAGDPSALNQAATLPALPVH